MDIDGIGYEHIDVRRIARLASELSHDITACLRFIDDFVDSWEPRRTRVLHAARGTAVDDGLAALLTLTTSSEMVGAVQLSSAARDLHSHARFAGRIPAPGAERLAQIGEAACGDLRHATRTWRSQLAG